MGDNSIFGRTVSDGIDALNFDLCDTCQTKFPNWVETKVEGKTIEMRLTCNECHAKNFDNPDKIDNEVVRQVDQDEALPEVTRPAWVEEFISEQETSGNLDTINTDNINSDQSTDQIEQLPKQAVVVENLAPWTTDFIREALFGLNIEKWFDKHDALSANQILTTITTLASLFSSQVANVKVTAIQGFEFIYKKNPSVKSELIQALNLFTTDLDEGVVNASTNLIAKISK